MKKIKYFLSILLLSLFVFGCKKDSYNDVSFVQNAGLANKLNALFEITQDNTGLVTITPNGEGATGYDIYFGDATTIPNKVKPGANTQHKYAEGLFNVRIVAYNASGKTTEVIKPLTVSFKAPENLVVTAAIDAANNFKVNVTAKADFETMFKVYYGDVANEIPIIFLEGDMISHVYATVGNYTIRIVALSGGAATTEFTKVITVVDPILLPINFESSSVNYAFSNFDGGTATKISNPNSTGINTSAKVGKMVKNAGQAWGGSTIKLGQPINFTNNKVFRMKVYSPRVGAKVLLKVENATNGAISFEKEVSTSVANQWEDLVFDYRSIDATQMYNNVVLIFDNGTMGDGSANFTWLFDDILLTNQIPPSILNLPVTFDLAGINYAVTDFGNASTMENSADPAGGTNKVAKTTKPTGAQTWAGTTIGKYFSSKVPFTSTQTQISIRVYSPAAGLKLRLKLEDHNDNTKTVETEAMTLTANAWETLVFDFANQSLGTVALNLSNNYDMASIFFDFGNAGNGKVFYWDDVTFLNTNISPAYLSLPIDFESPKISYNFVDFAGGVVSLVNNPDASGINTSTKVAKMIKGAGQVYAGSSMFLVNPINFSVKKTFKVKVYSPKVGTKFLLKVENSTNSAQSYEKEVSTTTANAWEVLTFDYSGIPPGFYDKLVWIFDLGTMGNGSSNFTYYFDDITLN